MIKAETDPRIRIMSTPHNLGSSAARNLGIEAARGDWIAFQDSDDEWLPEKLSKQMARLLEPGADWIGAYCGMVIIGTAENKPNARTVTRYLPGANISNLEGDILPAVLRHSFVSTQMLIARRAALQKISGFDEELTALVDWELMLRLSSLGQFAFVDEPLVLQRFSANSITRDQARRAKARQRIIDKHRDLFGCCPDILARHYRTMAGEHWQLRDIPAARATISAWRKLYPLDLCAWMHLARISIHTLIRRLTPRN